MRYKLDFMRFAEEDSQDFEEVIREAPGSRVYNVYRFSIRKYPEKAFLYRYKVDLNEYTDEQFSGWLSNWGYDCYADFVDYMDNHTILHNHELRLADCIVQYNELLEKELDTAGTYDDCIGRLTDLLGGRSPFDDSDPEEFAEENQKQNA